MSGKSMKRVTRLAWTMLLVEDLVRRATASLREGRYDETMRLLLDARAALTRARKAQVRSRYARETGD